MPKLVDKKGDSYEPLQYKTEKEFEATVVSLADKIFGEKSLYLDVKHKMGHSIPDGYVIEFSDPKNPKLYIIENEIKAHPTFDHTVPQILRFAADYDAYRENLREFLITAISKKPKQKKLIETARTKSSCESFHEYMDLLLKEDFHAIVLIDEIEDRLQKILSRIRAKITVIEIKSFKSEKGDLIHLHGDIWEDEGNITVSTRNSPRDRARAKKRRAARELKLQQADTILVPAQEEGFKATFLGQDCWYAIRIGARMIDRIKYIAAYQVAPVSAITHWAEVDSIEIHENTAKYRVNFKGRAKRLKRKVIPKNKNNAPQGTMYINKADLNKAKRLEDLL